jgi:predicted P-loop ATPase
MIVLEGAAQGEGKTTFLRELAVDPQFFTRMTTTGDLTHFRTIGKIYGPVIVEVAEMASLRGRDVESSKAWIDERVDRWQPAYARMQIDTPRTCVFAATVNPGQYLHDDRNRRYWPIACGPRIDLDAVRAEREQLWAEAVALYRSGVKWHPTRDESAALGLDELQESRREVDLLEETLAEALTLPRAGGISVSGDRFDAWQLDGQGQLRIISAPQAARLLGPGKVSGTAIAKAMRALNWRLICTTDKKRGSRWWAAPGVTETDLSTPPTK